MSCPFQFLGTIVAVLIVCFLFGFLFGLLTFFNSKTRPFIFLITSIIISVLSFILLMVQVWLCSSNGYQVFDVNGLENGLFVSFVFSFPNLILCFIAMYLGLGLKGFIVKVKNKIA